MKIAYNSAYIQIETSNFTFAQQAIIVYVCDMYYPPRKPVAQYYMVAKAYLLLGGYRSTVKFKAIQRWSAICPV